MGGSAADSAFAHSQREGEKLQRIFAFDNITPETVLAANHSVESTVNAIAELESVLEMKLRLFTDCACNPPGTDHPARE